MCSRQPLLAPFSAAGIFLPAVLLGLQLASLPVSAADVAVTAAGTRTGLAGPDAGKLALLQPSGLGDHRPAGAPSLLRYAVNPARYVPGMAITPNPLLSEGGPIEAVSLLPTVLLNWGSPGSAPGQFNFLTNVKTDRNGNVYVADAGNHRIQKFDADGNFLFQWGSLGSGAGQFNGPFDLAFDRNGHIFVTDYNNQRVQKFSASGAFLRQWGGSGAGNGQFLGCRSVAVDENGFVYVLDQNGHRIQKFTNDGDYLLHWGSLGSGDGQFNVPLALTVDPQGYVYVADSGNHRIQKFDGDGNFVLRFGSNGSGNSQFINPWNVATDPSGRVYVGDGENRRVQVFSAQGVYLTQFGGGGSEPGQFSGRPFLTVDAGGIVFAGEEGGTRLQKFTPTLLPAGLELDPINGLISGTPTVASRTAGYVVTASNSLGSVAVLLNLTVLPADYVITTTGGLLSVTETNGLDHELTVSEPAPGSIAFAASERNFLVDGVLRSSGDSGAIPLSGVTDIYLSDGTGNSVLNLGSFAVPLPNLTVQGSLGDDTVNLRGSLTFAPNARLIVDQLNHPDSRGRVSVATGARIVTSGTGVIVLKAGRSVALAAASGLETVDGGIVIEANQQDSRTAGTFPGIDLGGFVRSTGIGSVQLLGRAGSSGGEGVRINAPVTGGTTGVVLISGHGGGTGTFNFGISMRQGSISSNGADITLVGQGGGAPGAQPNYGLELNGPIAAGGLGNVSLTGTGGDLGVVAQDGISTAGGGISILGMGVSASGVGFGGAIGIVVNTIGQVITTGGGGSITLRGYAGDPATSRIANIGVYFISGGIVSNGGYVYIEGEGGGGPGSRDNRGIQLQSPTPITALGSARVALRGVGGAGLGGSHGVRVVRGARVVAVDDITIYASTTDGRAESQGFSLSDAVATGATVRTTAGNLTIAADTMALSPANVSLTALAGDIALRPLTEGVGIDLGSTLDATPGQLELSDAELGVLTAGTLRLGDATTGPIKVSAILRPRGLRTLAFTRDVTFAATGGFHAVFGPTAAEYQRLTAEGAVTLAPGAALEISATGGFVPTVDQSFLLLEKTSAGPIDGDFTGPGLTNFLGSGLDATLSAFGGDGNDLVFRMPMGAAPVFLSGNSVLFSVGLTGNFGVLASGLPAPMLALGAGQLPEGVTFDPATGLLAGVPAAGSGAVYPLVFRASNGVGPAVEQNFTLQVNRPPISGAAGFQTPTGVALVLTAAQLLAGASDPDGDALSIVSVDPGSGAAAGSVNFAAGILIYQPREAYVGTDAFTLVLADGRGGTASQTVSVTVTPANFSGALQIGTLLVSPTDAVINAFGLPGETYTVEYSDDLGGAWMAFGAVTANAFGGFAFTDALEPRPARRFYRVR